ncbi:MAG: TldD/PmbA family protein [candidate division KSB1 bacterium]|nr:TldD/PmbA family protein [candidate division KSB1 bacterium]
MVRDQDALAPVDFFARQFGLGEGVIRRVLAQALRRGGDFAELYVEYGIHSGITVEEGLVKDTEESVALGAGVRVISGERTGYAYTNDLEEKALLGAADTASAISAGPEGPGAVADLRTLAPRLQLYDPAKSPVFEALKQKVDLCLRAYSAASASDPRIRDVRVSFSDGLKLVLIANSMGRLTFDARPLVRLDVSVVAEKNGIRNAGYYGDGGRVGLDYFTQLLSPEEIARRAVEEALILLDASDPPAGEMPVVLAPGESGTMVHEAVGHLLEADANRKKQSIFWDKMGKKVASEWVTIYDDPTLPRLRGSYQVDDEGTEPQKTLLIDRGRLCGYLTDLLSARILGIEANGHGRRQSYAHVPIPRMANTYLAPGVHDPEEIIATVRRGLYAVSYQGGQVEDTGKFTFSLRLAYLIENGRITRPVRQATLIGSNIDVLQNIEMVGNDLRFGRQTATCGKEGQAVPVSDGTPTVKIRRMTVGGTA